MRSLKCAAETGRYVLGISNGFQILLEAGLLPGALLINEGIEYICADTDVTVENNHTAFTKQYQVGEQLRLPIAHGHGNYFCEAEELAELQKNGQIILRYAGTAGNPNGSLDNIAAITNKSGNVLGIMPQIDRALDKQTGSDAGVRLFESILEAWRNRR
jgi:phosphoribosylformylglycinamidine synthase